MTSRDRARVVKFWIQVAKEAKSIATKLLWATRGSQGRKQQVAQGMVPFLGLFLDDLLVDKLPEHNEDGDKTSKRVLSVVPHKVTLVLDKLPEHNEDGDKTSKRVLSVVPHKVTLVLVVQLIYPEHFKLLLLLCCFWKGNPRSGPADWSQRSWD
ncbi:Ras-specific guanine nucleotide-releasing factor 1 [Manis javanica]|nr:Ras-specific guanine nucleotide-releasing factor 1 [Manis javanica]